VRADAAAADRARAVHLAARAWEREGAIDGPARRAIEARYPDDRQRLGPWFRLLIFVFSLIAANGFLGVLMLCITSGGETVFGVTMLTVGIGLVVATEVLMGPLRRADSGMEAASALMALGFLSGGTVLLYSRAASRIEIEVFLITALVVSALGALRWGFAFLAAFGVAAGFALLARLPEGRLLWILAGAALAIPFLRLSESARLCPSHRRGSAVVLTGALLALYIAIHVGSWDSGWIEDLSSFHREAAAPGGPLRPLSILATAFLPVALLALGIVRRRPLLLNLGILLGVASLVTLRFYVHVAPLWVVLTGSGAGALGAALLLRRFLASGPDRERGGFTAEPLFEDTARRGAMEVVAALSSLGPAARDLSAGEGALKTGGGGFGGGGASGEY
jgi:hypothetical protein